MMLKFKRFLLRALMVFLPVVSLLFSGLWVRSFFTPDWVRWMEDHPAPAVTEDDAVVFSSQGGVGFYFTRTTFPAARAFPGGISWSHDKGHLMTTYPPTGNLRPGGTYFLGMHAAHDVHGPVRTSFGGEVPREVTLSLATSEWVLVLPYPVLVLVWLLPLPWLWRWYRKQRRYALGLCQTCGYDLRASPVRCPECGSEVSGAAGAPAR